MDADDRNYKPQKTLDERLDALTQSVELLAEMHKANEVRMERMERSITAAAVAFLQEWAKKNGNES